MRCPRDSSRRHGSQWEGDCIIWYYAVLFCIILHYTSLHRSTLYYTIPHYIVVHYTLLHSIILYYTLLYCNILYVLYYTVLYGNLLYNTVYIVLHCIVLHRIALHYQFMQYYTPPTCTLTDRIPNFQTVQPSPKPSFPDRAKTSRKPKKSK